MNNSEKKTMNRKTLLILVGGVLGAALIAWLVLVIGIFGGKTKKNNEKSDGTPAEVPEGMVVVYRATAEYTYTTDGERRKSQTAQYDDFGRITEWTTFSEDGSTSGVYTYKYDERGNLVGKIEKTGYGEIKERYVMTYDENGVLLTRDTFFRDNEQPRSSTYFNKDGNAIRYVSKYETSLYTDDGEIYECKEINKYTVQSVLSDDGRILERTRLYSDYTELEKFVYDESTRKLKECSTWIDGLLTKKIVYDGLNRYTYEYDGSNGAQKAISCRTETLDEYGNVLSMTFEIEGGGFRKASSEYSADSAKFGSPTRLINYDLDGSVKDYIIYEYSKAGQVLKEYYYNGDGSEKPHHYWIYDNYIGKYWELDENGNPVRLMTHLTDQDIAVKEYEYIRMVIPKEYMHEDEEHYVGIRYE